MTRTRISFQAKIRIIVLLQQDFNLPYVAVAERLCTEGHCVTRQTVSNVWNRYLRTGSIATKFLGGAKTKLTGTMSDYINKCYRKDDELSARDLQAQITSKFGASLSLSTIKRVRARLGWIKSGPRYCQLVRAANRRKRVMFARHVLWHRDTFDNVIFSDECTVMLEQHAKLCFRKKFDLVPKLKPTVKHPYKVHVWAGISKRGPTPLVIFDGIMDATFYTTILQSSLLPFIRDVYPDGYRFQQDNDPKHTSKLAQGFYAANDINWWKTPAESPDLNPIEMMWHELKHHLRRHVKPTNKDTLVAGISDFWTMKVTPEKCQKYINHINIVLPIVIQVNGHASGH